MLSACGCLRKLNFIPRMKQLLPNGNGGSKQVGIFVSFYIWHLSYSHHLYPWLDFGLPPHCPQVVWCHWGEIEPFSATLAQDGLAECDQPEKNPLKYSEVAGNWTRATGRTDSELSHWAIMTDDITVMLNLLGQILVLHQQRGVAWITRSRQVSALHFIVRPLFSLQGLMWRTHNSSPFLKIGIWTQIFAVSSPVPYHWGILFPDIGMM